MIKVLTLTFFIVFNVIFTSANAKSLEHPPIPEESPHTEKVAIVTLPEPMSKKEIEKLIGNIPELTLRYVFEHALNGFSVKGTVASLEKLSKLTNINLVEPVKTYSIESEESNKIIGVDEVRGFFDKKNNRLTGRGVTVGVIDTGFDYTHPDLRKSYGGGHDLVDGDDDPMETEGAHGQGTLHGTHVAGIIAANGRIKGVAPEAKIKAYRALGPGGTGTTEQVLAAIEQAIKDKVDVLNLSLGNSINGPDLPISLALNKAVEKGITSVTSSGNSGPNLWTVGSPGTAGKAISVGASTPSLLIPYLLIEEMGERFRLEPIQGSVASWKLDRSYPITFAGLGKKEDLKNVDGKVVLVERGEITFTEKAKNAIEAGAVAVIIYNNINGGFIGNLEEGVEIPVATVTKKVGKQIQKALKAKEMMIRTIIKEEKDRLADFSSRGPVTSTWEIKPDVVAPGVAINSTIPGGYLALQGTSMASPHVAGACALIKQEHPDWGPEEIKAALMNTAKPIQNEKGTPYKTYEQGAGRIQIKEAIKTQTLAMPASLQFGKFKLKDVQHTHKQYITLRNVSSITQKYSFSVPKQEAGIKWEIPLSFHVGPGEEKRVEVKMTVDPTLFKKKLHDGHLYIDAGGQRLSIPYLYVLEEPNYPRVMGFDIGAGDKKNTYRYEVYLPGGAEEFGIALFDPDSYQFVGFLDWKRKVGKGMLKGTVHNKQLPETGLYLAKVFAKKAGKEDMVEASIYISKE
ncbi:S8 family serine peptidase [Bacillus sp. 31A1R]|uniref:S8 family serine peptidase n=1 Tax=Robertmurraya mangrovi TaxID=3098077 RepID=A0ABU5IXF5_9BACI|nr:S8 family serine peptidase [Bacillus sp. 31A1R]MDZ5471807.1 S8 family serine peptidase [Bacillus sp. 31A1R]